MRKSLLLLALFCAACSNYSANLPSIKPYRMDIHQGNVVTPKMMMQLRPGMSKAQVKFIMGTPLVVDAFHPNRWDYFYQMRKDGEIIEQRRVIMDFEDDKLARIRGDVIPAGSGAGEVAGGRPANKAPVTLKSVGDPKPKEKGLLDSLKFWGDDEPEVAPAAKPDSAPVAEPVRPVPEAARAVPPAPVLPLAEPAADATAPAPETKVDAAPDAGTELAAPPSPSSTEPSGAQIKLPAEPRPEALPKVEQSPSPANAPAPVVKPVVRPAEKPVEAPRPRPRSNEPKQVPKPSDDLPPEDAPDYFERMLEKIGF